MAWEFTKIFSIYFEHKQCQFDIMQKENINPCSWHVNTKSYEYKNDLMNWNLNMAFSYDLCICNDDIVELFTVITCI